MDSTSPKKVTSVSEFIDDVFTLRRTKMAELSDANYWFFRGQKNARWSVIPNVFRDDALSSEYSVIQQALRQRPYDFRECRSDFEILTKLQHYGLGTRLLDVTLNPLVALYFASEECEEMDYETDQRGKPVPRDGKIVFRYSYGHKLDELAVRIACVLPFFNFDEGLTLSAFGQLLRKNGVITAEEESYLSNNDYEGLISAIQSNNYVMAAYSNDRLLRQSGAFIIPTAIRILPNEQNIASSLIRKANCPLDDEFESEYFIIPHECKAEIRDELDFLNINEATLFPELEHQLIYLKNKKLSIVGKVEPYERYVKPIPIEDPFAQEEIVTTPEFMEPKPDVEKVISAHPEISETTKDQIIEILQKCISVIDWWMKDAIVSRTRRDLSRILQTSMSANNSKLTAASIVDDLKDPKYRFEE